MSVLKYLIESLTIPSFLYHATYKPLWKNIQLNGLGGIGSEKKKWEDSKHNVVYLAIDPDIAFSYAETSDIVPDSWLDKIIVLKIDTKNLDKNKFQIDRNVIDNEGDTIEYHGAIPIDNITILDYLQEEILDEFWFQNDANLKGKIDVEAVKDYIKKNTRKSGFVSSPLAIPSDPAMALLTKMNLIDDYGYASTPEGLKALQQAEKMKVPMKKVTTIQDDVIGDNLIKLANTINNGEYVMNKNETGNAVYMFKVGDEYLLADGNHRATIIYLSGLSTIAARVVKVKE